MALVPPAGGTTAAGGTTFAQQVSYYTNLLNEQYPGQLSGENVTIAQAYNNYMQAHTSDDPDAVYQVIIDGYAQLGGVPKTIEQAIAASGRAVGQIASGVGAGAAAIVNGPLGDITNWISSLGGMIASGLEGGVVTLLKDIWNVVSGPLLVIAGIVIAVVVLIVYFKNDITQAGGAVAALGAMAAV